MQPSTLTIYGYLIPSYTPGSRSSLDPLPGDRREWYKSFSHLTLIFYSPRSGFSFLVTAEGAILHGGYVKEYVKGKRVEGKALEDTWLLQYVLFSRFMALIHDPTDPRMNADNPLQPKWEASSHIPTIRMQGTYYSTETEKDRLCSNAAFWVHHDTVGHQVDRCDVWWSI